ncbi:MAG: ankyrin repeat domain-containing protein [Bryobacteraceae bacterium]
MPVKPLSPDTNLDQLEHQATDLLLALAAHDPQAAQRIREFHPRFHRAADAAIFDVQLSHSDAQLTIARERGFAGWPRLQRHIEKPTLADNLSLPPHERIEDATLRRAVDLLDSGDVEGLRAHLNEHPNLVHQHVRLEGGNYFQNPTLLQFVAENPIRRGTLPANIVPLAKIILDAGAKNDPSAMNETLSLVCSGRVPRECGLQLALIDLLCDYGADPNSALEAALPHGEFEAVHALLRKGARTDLLVAAALGRDEDGQRLLANANSEDRHRALALASQFGHVSIVRLLLDAGEDPNRYNPVGFHSHSTPLHQAALAGHDDVVRLLVERDARLDTKDTLWQSTPADWAKYQGRAATEEYLRAQEALR